MPFIDSKISVAMSDDQKDALKTRLGKAVSIIGKPESYLMVGINDNYSLYFAGEKVERGADVEVSLLGSASSAAYEKMTGEICKILEEELEIPGNKVYVTYHGVNDWGFNGRNF